MSRNCPVSGLERSRELCNYSSHEESWKISVLTSPLSVPLLDSVNRAAAGGGLAHEPESAQSALTLKKARPGGELGMESLAAILG